MQDDRTEGTLTAPILFGGPTAADRRASMRALTTKTARVLLEQARGLRRRNPRAAAVVARSVLAWARTRGHERLGAEAARGLGQAELLLGRPRAAVRRFDEARRDLSAADATRLAPELAQALACVGEGQRALHLLRDVRADAPDDDHVLAMLDVAEGNVLIQLERYDEALAPLQNARTRYTRLGRLKVVHRINANLGVVHSGLGAYTRAADLLSIAAAMFEEDGEATAAMQVRYNFAYVQFLRGEIHEALDILTGLRDRFAASGDDRHAALCDLDRGELELRLGRRAEAGWLFRRALAKFDALGLDGESARCRFFLAAVVRSAGDEPGGARRLLVQARRAFRRVGNLQWDALCRHRLAEGALASGRPQAALRQANRAAEALSAHGLGERAGRSQVLCARIELATGSPDLALARLRPLIEGRGASDWLACEAHHHTARVYAVLGHRTSAAKHALRSVEVLERQSLKLPPDDHVGAFLRDRRAVVENAASMVLWLGGRRAPAILERLARLDRHDVLREVLRLGAPEALARPPFGRTRRRRARTDAMQPGPLA